MEKVVIPTGGNVELPETAEEKAIREAAELEAAKNDKNDKTPEQIEAERVAQEAADEAARLAAEKTNTSTIIIANESGEETTFNLNDTGDAIDAEGKVIYTAAQLKEFEEPEKEVNSIEDISKLSGIVILSEDGIPKVYENTVEGFAQREADIKRLGYQEAAEKALESFFAENDDLAAMAKYKKTYGTLEGFNNHVDYTKLVLDKDNTEQLYDIIIKAELKKGTSIDRAKRIADFAKADNSLFIDAQESHTYLKTIQESEFAQAIAKEKAELDAAIEVDNNYFGIAYENGKEKILNVENSIYDLVVNKGTFGGLTIPIEGITIKDPKGTPKHFTRRQIFDYISIPVAEIDGELYSQAQIDEIKRTSNKEELIATYMRNLTGGNLDTLISTSKLKDKADQIRKVVIKSNSSKQTVGGGSKKVVVPVK